MPGPRSISIHSKIDIAYDIYILYGESGRTTISRLYRRIFSMVTADVIRQDVDLYHPARQKSWFPQIFPIK